MANLAGFISCGQSKRFDPPWPANPPQDLLQFSYPGTDKTQ